MENSIVHGTLPRFITIIIAVIVTPSNTLALLAPRESLFRPASSNGFLLALDALLPSPPYPLFSVRREALRDNIVPRYEFDAHNVVLLGERRG